MNYLRYFGLRAEPFTNAPVSAYYFDSAHHRSALLRLQHAVEMMKGLAILVGDIGAGKTTLARRLLDQLPDDRYEASLLVMIHSGITADWLVKRIAMQLGVTNPADDKLKLLSQLYRRLVQIHESGRRAVVLIDEAQMLASREVMEEFRGMLNLEIPGHKLLTFVFFGLPELEQNLTLDLPLAQRVGVRCRLGALDASATAEYIAHRLHLAGGFRPIFTDDAVTAIFRASGGVPRLINTVADNCLFEAFVAGCTLVESRLVFSVGRELGLEVAPAPSAPSARPAVVDVFDPMGDAPLVSKSPAREFSEFGVESSSAPPILGDALEGIRTVTGSVARPVENFFDPDNKTLNTKAPHASKRF